MAQAQEQYEEDEFSAQDAAQAYASAYAKTAEADAEDQREYRLIPSGTECVLGIAGFKYVAAVGKAAARIEVKCEVNEPEAYADGASNFTTRLSLNPVLGKNEDGSDKKRSGWDMTVDTLQYMFAAVNQVSAQEGKQAMVLDVLADFPNLDPDDVLAFHNALVDNANEKLRGTTFRTKVGVQKGGTNPKGGNYPDRQEFGKFDYPKANKK